LLKEYLFLGEMAPIQELGYANAITTIDVVVASAVVAIVIDVVIA